MASLVYSFRFKSRWSLTKLKRFKSVCVIVACVVASNLNSFCECWQGSALGSAFANTYRGGRYIWRKVFVRQKPERQSTENNHEWLLSQVVKLCQDQICLISRE